MNDKQKSKLELFNKIREMYPWIPDAEHVTYVTLNLGGASDPITLDVGLILREGLPEL